MKSISSVLIAMVGLAFTAGCDSGQPKKATFVLPGGDIAHGQATFVNLKCYECHQVDGVPGLPAPTVAAAEVVKLGGEVSKRRSYGDLVTAIIHPSLERTAKSVVISGEELEMPDFNAEMTVTQMLDLVAFLHPRYLRLKPLYYDDYYGP